MTTPNECKANIDSLKLIHQGTSQDKRVSEQLKPTYVQVDERKIENAVVFAKAYAQYLNFYGNSNTVTGDWEAFFSRDVSVQLALAAIQDVEYYKSNIKAAFDFLNNREHKDDATELKNQLGYLFSSIATLAKQLDVLKEGLPAEIALKNTLQNLIRSQLAAGFRQLILYYRDGLIPTPPAPPAAPYLNDVESPFNIMGAVASFKDVKNHGLSDDWITEASTTNWADYLLHLDNFVTYPASQIYGSGNTLFERLNHIATHNLFTAVFDQFLKVFARVVVEAKAELEKTFTDLNNHEPHYALFLSFLKLFDYARAETNTLTQRHLDFYYRDILKLKEKPAEPSHAHLLIELAKHVDAHEIKTDELFSAGKDDLGIDVFFANDQNFVANQAKVTELKSLYRHKNILGDSLAFDNDRLFASPVANSADGLGAKLTTADSSWQPFFNKIYENGKLSTINMPQAEVGFALASHYLWLAEGTRTITVEFTAPVGSTLNLTANQSQIICLVSTEKGWFEKAATQFITEAGVLKLVITLSGADPAVTPYSSKIHGYDFSTNLPMLLVKLRHQKDHDFIYPLLQNLVIEKIGLTVAVTGLKSLAVSNDFGSVDTSKPFQPFGAQPVIGNAMIFGSKEIFQKKCTTATLNVVWQNLPSGVIGYGKTVTPPISIASLQGGAWVKQSGNPAFSSPSFSFSNSFEPIFPEQADFSSNEVFYVSARAGFTRLSLNDDFGQADYFKALQAYLIAQSKTPAGGTDPGKPPYIPVISSIEAAYTASQNILLNESASTENFFEKRPAKFFHLMPFGQCEQHNLLNSAKKVFLVPQFNNAEFYIGITSLLPPQNLALLFQVADGTANPLVEKPKPHIQWSYLSNNEWLNFGTQDVQDSTDGLINSGIITFTMPDKANSTNTMLPSGQHWLRAAVTEKSDAVCKLLTVSAQGLKVTFQNQNNDPSFMAKTLAAGTISKLKQPDAAVKKVTQPFASFGGRGAEQSAAFYTRISERLRHKDRTITLWDYEHLILEAFPQIYQVKCLNHTAYEPTIYNELAAGHVTVVTIPNQQFHNLHDPLRPYTSLGLLTDIEKFLQKKLSCFVKLHVKNPQFEAVGVAFKVKFYAGFDETFYLLKLKEAITRFLSPWAFSDGSSPTFGGKIYSSVLLNFVEEQPYVDYVTDFKLSHSYTTLDSTGSEIEVVDSDVVEVEGSKAVSILVSANDHDITTINPTETPVIATTCPCASL